MRNLYCAICFILLTFPSCSSGEKEAPEEEAVTRYGSVIRVKPEKLAEYKDLHANPWPGVNKMIRECNIRNYSIYYRDGYLFSYFEYTGNDFEADMEKMAADSLTREWWKLTDPCQEPVESAVEGVWWADMEEVYHLD
jgi:L-rhamnose mutarotase